MKIVFLGTPPVAATCLDALAADGRHQILSVATHPDRIAGRGLKTVPTAVKEAALRLGLPVLEVSDAKDPAFAQNLSELGADLLVVVAFVILPSAVLASARLGAVNLHGSLLPRWRGAAPVQRSVAAGETETGATVFRLDTGVDTGGIVVQERIAVGPDETSGEVLERLGALGGPLLLRAMAHLEAHPEDRGLSQDPTLATRAPKLFPEEGSIDWSLPAKQLHDKIRAFHPAPGAWCRPGGALLKIWRTKLLTDSVSDLPSGHAVCLSDGRIAAGCGTGALELLEVQPEGRRRQSGADWFNGLRAAGPVVLSLIPGYAARRAALVALLAFEREDRPVAETLSFDRTLDSRDHGLALQIASTSVRWKALLDHHLAPFLRTPTAPELLWILRLSVAQAHLLKSIPIHSAVDLGVELAHEAGGKKASGFANAVLRRAAHNPIHRPLGEDAASLSIRHSHPQWLVERWLSRHGLEATISMLKAGNLDPALWVRVRPGTTDLPWTTEQVLETAHDGLFSHLDLPRDLVLDSAAFRRGDLGLQDPASGAVALELARHLHPGMRLIDLCAAPGGKIACLRDAGLLDGVRTVALDNSAFRQKRTLAGFRQRAIPALVGVADGLHPPLHPHSVDAVVLDAPCSNLGVLSRRPEARWRARPDDPARHAILQSALLESALGLVKPGGLVLYSVCSTEPEECDGVTDVLHGRAQILSRSLRLPGQEGWDGFFSILARVGNEPSA